MLDDRLRDGEAVEGARAAADLVEDHEAPGVERLRIRAVCAISTRNVLAPRARSSPAPIRAKSRSTIPIRALRAGRNSPPAPAPQATRPVG
jgi:hypothetical protein